MKRLGIICAALLVLITGGVVYADVNYTQGAGTVIFDFICFTTKHCSAFAPIDSAGTEKATSANPWVVDTGTSGNLINAVKSPPGLATTGGWTPVVKTGIVGTVLSIKASAGWLGKVQCDNNNSAWSYLQVFNAATGSVTLGTTVPIDMLPLAPNFSNGFAGNMVGVQFGTAISVAATTTPTGATPVASGLNCAFWFN